MTPLPTGCRRMKGRITRLRRPWRICWLAGLIALPAAAQPAPFPSGILAGDVTQSAAVLTCQTAAAAELRVELALTAEFAAIVQTINTAATEENGLAAKVDVAGLSPRTTYFYRFVQLPAGATSRVGRFRTAPAADDVLPFRFVHTGDSDARTLPYIVLGFAAAEQADLWFWYGDTIYGDVPAGGLGVATTLEDYRAKYRQNLADPYLQAMLQSTAVWVGWDDHEVTNDYDGGDPEPDVSRAQIEAGYRAFFESLPIRPQGVAGDEFRVYRSFRYGRLAEFFILDGRQYRSADARRVLDIGLGGLDPYGYFLPTYSRAFIDILRDPSRTLLGREQLEWLKRGLAESPAQYKFILNPVPFTSLLVYPDDRWDGYDAERYDLLRGLDLLGVEGVIVLTTDSHANTFNPDITQYLRNFLHAPFSADFAVPEFVVGPIGTSTAGGVLRALVAAVFGGPANPLAAIFSDVLVDFAEWRVLIANGLTFIDSNRYAYLAVDVRPDGVTLIHRGIDTDSTETRAIIRDLHIAELDERGRPR